MAVDLGARRRRRRNRFPSRVRRSSVRAGRLWSTLYGEEVAFAETRDVTVSDTAGTGTAWVFVHPKTWRNRRVPNIFCDSFALNSASRRSDEPDGAAFLTYGRAEIAGVGCAKPGKTEGVMRG